MTQPLMTAHLLVLATFVSLACAASVSVTHLGITSLQGCSGRSGLTNVTGCAAGMTLMLTGFGFDLVDYDTEAAVGIGSVYDTCTVLSASSFFINCTLPDVPLAGSAFFSVFIFNRSSGVSYTDLSWVGLQYLSSYACSSTSSPSLLSSSSSRGTGGRVQVVSVQMVSGCGWMDPSSSTVYGCNGDVRLAASSVTLRIDRLAALPADWELAVYSSNNSVKGSDACSESQTTMVCTLPYLPRAVWGAVVDLWLQDSYKRMLSSSSLRVSYAAAPIITFVTGCCSIDMAGQATYGCGLPSPMLTVVGSGFARAFNGGEPALSPIVVESATSIHQCVVSSHTEWSLECAYLVPAITDDNAELLQLTVVTGQNISNSWRVQINSGNSTCSSPKPPPRITSVYGSNCNNYNAGTLTSGCSTNSATLFTITGSGFSVPSDNGVPVQLVATQSSSMTYSCGVSQLSDTMIVCMELQPSLEQQDSGQIMQLTIATRYGTSNIYWVGIVDDGPYNPNAGPSSSSTFFAGMTL